jgi:pyruvate dehydrogenase E2 component (dihydrolipoamide acetyltransferase)
MSIFKLPDLGEGLPDAEICQWHVKVGDKVTLDQPLVSMETAKAVVDVPAPQDGIIETLHGKEGDVILTGKPLVTFKSDEACDGADDSGTVVGNIKSSNEVVEDNFTIGSAVSRSKIKAGRETRALAKQHNLDLETIQGSGLNGLITLDDVLKAAHPLKEGFQLIKGVRRTMVRTMSEANHNVVHTNLFDEVSIRAWGKKEDITVRLIRALSKACEQEPTLNSWFDGFNVASKPFSEVHLGLAMDSADGLFVPVIQNANQLSASALRKKIEQYKVEVGTREISPENLTGATITLSNFGKFAGRFATPIIVPPTVAIIAVGQLKIEPRFGEKNEVVSDKLLPISLSFDHRAVTGGEATRFLGVMLEDLKQAK